MYIYVEYILLTLIFLPAALLLDGRIEGRGGNASARSDALSGRKGKRERTAFKLRCFILFALLLFAFFLFAFFLFPLKGQANIARNFCRRALTCTTLRLQRWAGI